VYLYITIKTNDMTYSQLQAAKETVVYRMFNSFERYSIEGVEILKVGKKIVKTECSGNIPTEMAERILFLTVAEVEAQIAEHKLTNKWL
jgi:hypothetical protein